MSLTINWTTPMKWTNFLTDKPNETYEEIDNPTNLVSIKLVAKNLITKQTQGLHSFNVDCDQLFKKEIIASFPFFSLKEETVFPNSFYVVNISLIEH